MKKFLKMTILIIVSILLFTIITAALFINLSPQFGAKSDGDAAQRIASSSNSKDNKFQNLQETVVMKKMDYSTIPGYFTKGDKIPDWSIPVEKVSPAIFGIHPDSVTRLTWFGHSAILLEMDNKKIFIDPMLGNVPAPHPWLGASRFNNSLPLSIDLLPQLDAVLISHDHYDHLDYGSIVKIKDRVKHFYVPLGISAHLEHWGVDKAKITELDWWQEAKLEGITLTATPARHFSGRGIMDRNSTLWCSWVISGAKSNIFYGGDSGYDDTFETIGNRYGPFDLTMLECGQYDEQWPEIHMMPEETVQAHIDLRGKVLMPIHWGAFKLALHRWDEPVDRLLAKANMMNIKVTTPKIGEPIILGISIPSSKWWEREARN